MVTYKIISATITPESYDFICYYKKISKGFNFSKWLDQKIKEDFSHVHSILVRELKGRAAEAQKIVEMMRDLGLDIENPIMKFDEMKNLKQEKDGKITDVKDV